MIKQIIKRLLSSAMGSKGHHGNHYGHGPRKYSSSDYKHRHGRPHQGHGHYKKKYSSYSS
ncbi:hypothetical protein M3223_13765 [Paenibacillus pasadenensis]|uniref:hypothetical protein n=1 Tax=Paenibacillus pasadenensis TaxID=217090 RepID=UPI00203FBFD6|nr:hypothetical protein [Paenibacillus pasadenensis]MCM3748413.1 hypothetical protein [Paenibacillus pasadenensis]